MTEALLTRILAEPEGAHLSHIPFPEHLAPKGLMPTPTEDGSLPRADVLLVTWTSAEWMALGDVLAQPYKKAQWKKYTKNWSTFEPHLTGRSPARDAKCLGEFMLCTIGEKIVCLFHSQLHLAVDDDTAPVVQLWHQIISEVSPDLIITSGTAGGIGESTELGDVFVVGNAKFNCTKTFADKPWAQKRFQSFEPVAGPNAALFPTLVAPNAAHLPKNLTTRTPTLTFGGDVETVDYFGFADTDDSYHIVSNDPRAHSEEMDDGTAFLALSSESAWSAIRLVSIRNASDPEVPSSIGTLEQQSKWASGIYEKWGYTTTIGSAIACWAVIADS